MNPEPEQDTNDKKGTVIARFGKSADIETSEGQLLNCAIRKAMISIVCGDVITWQGHDNNDCVICDRQERKTLLERPDASGKYKPIAANIDQIIIVSAPRPGIDLDMIDRYLVAAELIHIEPLILLNKTDLYEKDELQKMQDLLNTYQIIGYDIVYSSVKQDHGLETLLNHLRGKTSILVGQSGVGKSSLAKHLLPDIKIAIGKLSDTSGQGRHTTTTTRSYHIDAASSLIDSPGIREFNLWKISPSEVASGFREFAEHHGNCRFNDCAHRREPDCAINTAVTEGKIAKRRYDSFIRLCDSFQEQVQKR
ncbi:MAG: small ribosomal subunit biogenesis GTPase RsgA [Gammaproteobacteria bacterium]|nr:MAG: small ribosomal subunit biogenesis GTPase RsgA [Gammaproteobacteria bacterium]